MFRGACKAQKDSRHDGNTQRDDDVGVVHVVCTDGTELRSIEPGKTRAVGRHLMVRDSAHAAPEPVGGEHLVHVFDQQALGLRDEEVREQGLRRGVQGSCQRNVRC